MTITTTERRAMELGCDLIQQPDDTWKWISSTESGGGFKSSLKAAQDYLKHWESNS